MPTIRPLRAPLPASALAVALALAGCAVQPERQVDGADPEPQAFRCGDDRVLARFRPGEVELRIADRTWVLPAVVAASGARYAQGADEFWSRGSEARLRLDGVSSECRLEAVDPWRQAQDRGAAFRAVGQEPGWVAELGPGPAAWLEVQLDYGARTLRIEPTRRLADAAGVAGDSGGEAVELRISPEPCTDVMSGEAFEMTARLRVGARSLAGCGRFLAD